MCSQQLTRGFRRATPAGELATAAKENTQRYVIDLTVNPQSLVFDQGPDGARRSEIQCAVVAYDADSRLVNYLNRGIRLNVPMDQYAWLVSAGTTVGIPIRLVLNLPTGQTFLRIAVFDPGTSRTGSLEFQSWSGPGKVAGSRVRI